MTSRILRATLACLTLTILAGSALTAAAGGQPRGTNPAPRVDPPIDRRTAEAPLSQDQLELPSEHVRFRPIIRVAQDYTLRAGDSVREIRSVFGNVTIEGRVEQDVVVAMGSARLAPTAVIEGSLVVAGGSATIEEGATVGEDLVVVGGTLTAAPGFSPNGEHVVVGSPWIGDSLRDLLPWITRGLLWGRVIVPDLGWIWAVVLIFFLVYLALNTVFDRPVASAADLMVHRPVSTFVIGLLVLVLTLPALALIAASVIGLALVPFVLCALVVVALVGKTAVARAMGRSVVRSESPENRFPALAAFVIGSVLLTLAYMVPILGFVTWALTSVLGLGAAASTFRGYLRRERGIAPPPADPIGAAPASPPAPGIAASPSMLTRDLPASSIAAQSFEPEPPVSAPLPLPPPPARFTSGLAQYPRATILDRAAAFALDCILVAIAGGVLDLMRHDGYFPVMLLAYHVAFWAWKGTTLGGIICNLRVVGTHGGELRFVDALVRGLTGIFSIAALGIGCLWMLQDPERQMWHDKVAGTLVVKVPREVVLA
jgi:uncharacterized RDD family membrane protein YckC